MTPVRAFALVLACATSAAAAPRVSPRARMVANGQLEARFLSAPNQPDARAQVLVEIDGGASALQALGFDALALTTHVARVRATASDLARLLALPDSAGVRAVEERRVLHTLLDQSATAIGAPAARQELGVDGTGVLIGIVDTGVDFRHPDLRKADGHTRIAALLDISQMDDGRHPELGMLPGRVWLRDEIDAQLAADAAGMTPSIPVSESDTNGHGTHVAGIAASNGLATGHGFPAGRYVGIAPGADLIVVQATHGGDSFADADVIAAAQFVVDMATRLGEPVVANFSLGGPGGPHDGTTALETGLGEAFPTGQPGHVMVVAAGNDGQADLHAGFSMLDGERVIPLHFSDSTSDHDQSLSLELWYSGSVDLWVETPNGFVSPIASAGGSVNTDQIVTNHTAEGKIVISNDGQPRSDGRRSAGVTLVPPMGAEPSTGTWKLHVRGQANRFDAWITDVPPASTTTFTDWVDEDERAGLPATAPSAIVVGSFSTRNSWVTVDGMTITRKNVIGAPSTFTSSGPSADGRFVPDLLAPGEYIVSSLSADAPPTMPGTAFYVPSVPTFGWADDGAHAVLRGTSQASPHIAGAIALMLQLNPTLDVTAAREILRTTAHPPSAGWSPREGFGHVDVKAALHYLSGQRGSTVDANQSVVGLSRDLLAPGDETTIVTVTPRDSSGVAIGAGHTVTIEASGGAPVGDVVDAGWGRYERTFVAHAPRGTAAVVTATVDGVALAAQPTFYIAADRSEVGMNFVAAGGCSATPVRERLPLAFVVLGISASMLIVRNRRRRRGRSTLEP